RRSRGGGNEREHSGLFEQLSLESVHVRPLSDTGSQKVDRGECDYKDAQHSQYQLEKDFGGQGPLYRLLIIQGAALSRDRTQMSGRARSNPSCCSDFRPRIGLKLRPLRAVDENLFAL